ncbi:hypothetical protein [Acinetobacter sp. ANC 3832]|uniref:hypothetical protein n=1 Tax=Acinetobacter sp. ANC 3832 TaxID=1977874 RepID=UPI000A32E990|nr:hypothetical protein [Acinetobacter sp. ANC 3832]OTG94147.1 hypothetical protein B9T35_06980 [Acinetobacter sp. ANC 3832]
MILRLSYRNYDNGAYGTVFFNKTNNKAIKVFKRKESNRDEQIKSTFKSEVSAYNIAMENNNLKTFVPEFYGEINDIEKILDEYGSDISKEYFLNLAYAMKYIPKKFVKNNDYRVDVNHKNEVFKLFDDAGITYVKDSSVSVKENGEIVYIIDFAVNDHSP